MMKIFLGVAAVMVAATTMAQSPAPIHFNLNGKIDPVGKGAVMILHYRNGSESIKDTVALKDGKFSFAGNIEKPVKGVISVLRSTDNPLMMMSMGADGKLHGRDGIVVYLDKGNISIKGPTLKTATVSGSRAHDEYLAYEKLLQPVYDKLSVSKELMDAIEDKKSEAYKKAFAEYREVFKEFRPLEEAYIRAHTDSYVAWNIMADKSVITDPKLYTELYALYGPKFTQTEDGMLLKERIQSSLATMIGQPAPVFTQNDPDGKPITLSDLRGKYVLIDFWASWCGPCRAENPNVVKAYKEYKDKNFEILGVSLDEDHSAWVKAIQKDGLPWLQVSDLKGWQNEVAVQYFIRGVPQNLLLDPQGIIIAKNLRGEQLMEKLAEVLN